MDNEESEDAQCIGNLEHHLHSLFSSTRCPGDDFVYSAGLDMFNTLEDYCDDSTFHEPKPPLLILDESGSGKSALLSNWLHRKQQKLAQGRKGDEFVFWHAVGCSRQSMNVNSLIRRLMHALKNRYDLVRDVPFAQDRLSWELPRFFEMASKRGRIVIVLDGVHRLVTNEDTEAGLAWLPLEFPPNVRIILTATKENNSHSDNSDLHRTPTDSQAKGILSSSVSMDGSINESRAQSGDYPNDNNNNNDAASSDLVTDLVGLTSSSTFVEGEMLPTQSDTTTHGTASKGSKILAELKRRKWRSVRVKPMDRSQCRNALDTYILKSVQQETMGFTTGPFLTQMGQDGEDSTDVPPLDTAPGFLLFDNQRISLLTHKLGGTPMFLRLFLQCSHYAVRRGFSLWQIWEDWLRAESVDALLTRILYTMECGYEPSSETRTADRIQTENAGSLQTLRILYPWHPSFQETDDVCMDGGDAAAMEQAEVRVTKKQHIDQMQNEEANVPLSTKVMENLGDQQWLALGGFAESVLHKTCQNINMMLQSTIEHAHSLVEDIDEARPISAAALAQNKLLAENNGYINPLSILDATMQLVTASVHEMLNRHNSLLMY